MNSLRLPFTCAQESAAMRRRAAELLAGQPPDVIQDVLLVITELVDNVVQHTDSGGELHMRPDAGTLLVEVHDRSRSFPQLQRRDLRRAGGRGLLLVAAIAQSWGSRPTETGKVVWAEVACPPVSAPRPDGPVSSVRPDGPASSLRLDGPADALRLDGPAVARQRGPDERERLPSRSSASRSSASRSSAE